MISGAPARNETVSDCSRILNGRVADPLKYPFQVSIQQQVQINALGKLVWFQPISLLKSKLKTF